jgi:hypothetical protein
MMADYNSLVSLSREEFNRLTPNEEELKDENKYTKSDDEDIARMERLLDLRDGVLALDPIGYYLERIVCECGRTLTMYDLVFTGLVDAGHSKSFIAHTFIGNKLIFNRDKPRPLRCSQCSRVSIVRYNYQMLSYGCSSGD